jgi:polysaccharide export outer membrane protein
LLIALMTTSLTGCGVVYNSSSVSPGITEEGKVRVLPITAETVMVANKGPYQPKALPAYFSQTAGVRSSGGGGIAPPPTAFDRVSRPADMETRLPPAVAPGNYRIGVGDVVLLATPKSGSTVEQLTGILAAQSSRQGYTVQDDGTISVPNVEDAEATLFQRFLDQQIDPTFSLEIAEFHSKKVTIGGAVGAPAVVPITLSPLYLDEALAAAGGATAADIDYATVRLYRDGTLYQIPLKDLYNRRGAQRIQLAAGDSIFVDSEYELDKAAAYFEEQIKLATFKQAARQAELTALSTEVDIRRAALEEARSNFDARLKLGAEARDYVYITGEVGKQQRFALPYDQKANLADALYDAAGGIPAKTGSPKEIYVLRGSDNPLEFASITAWHLDVRNAAALILATRFELHPNDVIFVAAHPVTHWSNVVNSITPSLISTTVGAVTD